MHNPSAELLLEGVNPQFLLVFRSHVVSAEIEEAKAGFFKPHHVAPIQQAICAADHRSPGRVGCVSIQRARKQSAEPEWSYNVAAGTEHIISL